MSDSIRPTRYAARFDNLPAMLAAVQAVCQQAGFDSRARHRVELVLEEAFANSVRHGYGGEGDHAVWLSVAAHGTGLRVVFADAAPAFDPLAGAALPAEGHVGGLGRVLIKTLPTQVDYRREDGRNILTMDFAHGE